MLLAAEMLRQLRVYEQRAAEILAATAAAAEALAAATERHGLDRLQVEPPPPAPAMPGRQRASFLGLAMLALEPPAERPPGGPPTIDPSPELAACRAAFERLVSAAADAGVRAGNLGRLAREYRRTERRARALEKVLLPEVEDAMRRVDEQLDTMDREDVIRGRRSRMSEYP